MSSFTKLTYHVVFGTKYRRKTIRPSFQERLYEYAGGIIRSLKGHLIEMGGVEDHVHMLANLTPARAISDAVRDIKANTSRWIDELAEANGFEWQSGYGAFTVSYSQVDVVRGYIRNQAEHHRTVSFHEEYSAILKKHGIEFDPKHLFDGEHHG